MTDARALYTGTQEGPLYGQYAPSIRKVFNDAIAAEEAKNANTMTVDQLISGIETLKQATLAYKAKMVREAKMLMSTEAKPVWYYIKGDNPSGGSTYGKVLTKSDALVAVADKVEGSDDQLWRFEMNPDFTVKIINKTASEQIMSNGQSAQASLVAAGTGTNYTALTHPNGLNVEFKTGNQYLHGDQQKKLVDWNDAANPNSAWGFEYASGDASATCIDNYTLVRMEIRSKFDITSTSVGDYYGHFPAADRAAFEALLTAEEDKDPYVLTPGEMSESLNTMKTAFEAYMAINTDPCGSQNLAKWYTLESVQFPGKFLNVDPVTMALTIAPKDNSDNQLFRFQKKEKGLNIICKSRQDGTVRCENDAWDIVYNTGTTFSKGNGDWDALGYFPWRLKLVFGANGTQTLIESLVGDFPDSEDGTAIVNNGKNYGYNGDAAWKVTLVKEEATTGVSDVAAGNVIAFAQNKMIVVKGATAPVKVYTVSGIAVDATKPVKAGVYLVKTGGRTYKVSVR